MVEADGPKLFASYAPVDLSEPGALGEVQELVGEQPLAGLLGVAGARPRPELEAERDEFGWFEPEAFATVVADNLLTQYVALKGSREALLKGVAEFGQASATMVGSINSLVGFGDPAYSGGKAGLHGLMLGVTRSLGRLGVRINIVAPGSVNTRTRRHNSEPPSERLSETTALNKIAGPEDIARALVSVTCDLTHMTGQTLVIDGGQIVARE